MRKTLLIGCLVVLSLLVVGQVGGAAELWNYWLAGGEHDAISALMRSASEQYPDKRFTERKIPGNLPEIRRQLGAAFLAGNPPELFQTSVGYDLKSFVDAGHIQPIDELWEEIRGDEIFPAGIQSMVKFDGHAWAIPLNMHVISNVYYNKRIFDEYGLEPPTTWDEYKELSAFLRSKGIQPMATAAGVNWVMYNFYDVLVTVLGGDGYMELGRGNVSFTSDEMREAFKLYGETLAASYMDGWGGVDWPQAAEPFMLGLVAMYQMGDWLGAFLEERGLVPGVDFDIFPAPGATDYMIVQVDAITATKDGADKEGAMAFLKAAASVDGQSAFNSNKGSVAANLEVSPDIYGPILKRTYDQIQAASEAGKVLPNLLVLLPPELYQEFGQQLERYSLNPTDDVMESALETLEEMRLRLAAEGAFVEWPGF